MPSCGQAARSAERSAPSRPALARICVDVGGHVPGGYVLTELRSGRSGRYVLHRLFPGRCTVQFSIGCGDEGSAQPSGGGSPRPRRTRRPSTSRAPRSSRRSTPRLTRARRSRRPSGRELRRPAPGGICVEAPMAKETFRGCRFGQNGRYRLDGLAGGRSLIRFDPVARQGSRQLSEPAAAGNRQAGPAADRYDATCGRPGFQGVVQLTRPQGRRRVRLDYERAWQRLRSDRHRRLLSIRSSSPVVYHPVHRRVRRHRVPGAQYYDGEANGGRPTPSRSRPERSRRASTRPCDRGRRSPAGH